MWRNGLLNDGHCSTSEMYLCEMVGYYCQPCNVSAGMFCPVGSVQTQSSLECKSATSSGPACQVVFTSLSAGSRPLITIEVANSDFNSAYEYVSRVLVGNQTIGTNYLASGGEQCRCDVMSKIVDAQVAPAGTVSASGDLVVRIETSSAVNCCPCSASWYLYAQVSIFTPVVGVECPAGYFCPGGASDKRLCPEGTYAHASGSTDPADCLPCPSGSTSKAGSSECQCDAGYFGDGITNCTPCPSGSSAPAGSTSMGNCSDRINDWGSPEHAQCIQPDSWTELLEEINNGTVKTGGLGKLMEIHGYETWQCLLFHSCATDPRDPWFCFVYHETNKVFTPWGQNARLKLVEPSSCAAGTCSGPGSAATPGSEGDSTRHLHPMSSTTAGVAQIRRSSPPSHDAAKPSADAQRKQRHRKDTVVAKKGKTAKKRRTKLNTIDAKEDKSAKKRRLQELKEAFDQGLIPEKF